MHSFDLSGSLALALLLALLAITQAAGVNLPIYRRGGRFSRHESTNLTRLATILGEVEGRYARSFRQVESNRIVRKWHQKDDLFEDVSMFDGIGDDGSWIAIVAVGDPPQPLEFDLDMLHPDFFTLMTTSGKGTGYDATKSLSHEPSHQYVHSMCQNPSDTFSFNTDILPLRLDFPICRPPPQSRYTLLRVGSVLGLGPQGSLARLPDSSILTQLRRQNLVGIDIWSITLLNSETGILSIGNTIAKEVERATLQAAVELKNIQMPHATPEWIEEQIKPQLAVMEHMPWDDHFKWTNIQGANGWWTALMAGVWINGAKVLKNQPVLFDIQSPFILAPPLAVARIYESVGGASRLPMPHDNFFAFPCLNTVSIAFEIGGWNFPVMAGEGLAADAVVGPDGGKFSLGKMALKNKTEEVGTGYCVGTVAETTMGTRKGWARAGMVDMWVIGEPFFRGLGVVFDQENGRIGVRSY